MLCNYTPTVNNFNGGARKRHSRAATHKKDAIEQEEDSAQRGPKHQTSQEWQRRQT